MYRIYFIGKRGQGYIDIDSNSKEAAIKAAAADLGKDETILTIEEITTAFYHFEYRSSANPYIAKTEKERDRIIKKYTKSKIKINEIKPGFYMIFD